MRIARQLNRWCAVLFISLWVVNCGLSQTVSNTPPVPPESLPDQEALRAYLFLQEQVRATQRALEQNRQETEALTARSAAALTEQFKALTQSINDQRTREIEAMQSTNRLLLVVVGGFACVGFLAMLLTSWLQMRALNRLTEFSSGLAASVSAPGLNMTGPLISNAAAAQANSQLFGALDRIERRMRELESAGTPGSETAIPTSVKAIAPTEEATAPQPSVANGAAPANGTSPHPDQISLLLARGQSLLSLGNAETALECFDAVLREHSEHAEALVKRGAALEMLNRYEEAMQSYDRAIAADDSLTIAHLQKGGLFNRLERYEEALTCYERALQSQDREKSPPR
jgi:tetratricopeptide (TPR) repeat protein